MKQQIRNIAVIAHVDHGKTTLVDALLKQTNVFRENQEEMRWEQIMDTNELERERGITIMAKVCSINFKGTKINIIDTPGHVDFAGEVERTLGMAEGALLIVDAQEGPMPQTRFVLKKALELDLKIIVVINKLDKKLARVKNALKKVEDLFLELVNDEGQLEYQVLFAIGKRGVVLRELPESLDIGGSVKPLLEAMVSLVPEPKGDKHQPLQMLVSALDYDNHLGRIAIGKIESGKIIKGKAVYLVQQKQFKKIERLMVFEGLDRVEVEQAEAGEIVALAGIEEAMIGDTLGENEQTAALTAPEIAEPTIHITLGPNTSPFAAKEGIYTTSRQLEERLKREVINNVGLKVERLEDGRFKISGRGELHLSVLLETMRREGYEMEVGKPEVITRVVDGKVVEPVEEVVILVPQEYVGTINQELGKRKAEMRRMEPSSETEVELVFEITTRNLIGLRNLLLTETKGTMVMSSQMQGYKVLGETLPKFRRGVLIAATTGKVAEYGLKNLKGRGVSFVSPGFKVYEGMIIGENAKDIDIEMNVTKEKNLTNHRTKSHQGITQLAPDRQLSLEQALEYLEEDELLEITPVSLRLRKKYLTELERRRKTNGRMD